MKIAISAESTIDLPKELLEKSLSIMENYIGQDNHLMMEIL